MFGASHREVRAPRARRYGSIAEERSDRHDAAQWRMESSMSASTSAGIAVAAARPIRPNASAAVTRRVGSCCNTRASSGRNGRRSPREGHPPRSHTMLRCGRRNSQARTLEADRPARANVDGPRWNVHTESQRCDRLQPKIVRAPRCRELPMAHRRFRHPGFGRRGELSPIISP